MTVVFYPEATAQIFANTDQYASEVAWVGLVKKSRAYADLYQVNKVLVYPQENTAVTSDSSDDYAKWMIDHADDIGRMKMSGHSHVNMSVFPSMTDIRTWGELLKRVDDFYLYQIVNKRREMFVMLIEKGNMTRVWARKQVVADHGPIIMYLDEIGLESEEMYGFEQIAGMVRSIAAA